MMADSALLSDTLNSGMPFHASPRLEKRDSSFVSCLLILQNLHYVRTRQYVVFDDIDLF